MSEPKTLSHNSADTLAQAESGVDLSRINTSTLPSQGDLLEVSVGSTPVGVTLTPVKRASAEFIRGIGAIKESPGEALLHALVEDPDSPPESEALVRVDERTLAHPDRFLTVSQRRESLVWYALRDDMYYSVLGDRICVRQDTLESEHSCRTCHGRGFDDLLPCPMCDHGRVGDTDCTHCIVTGFGREDKLSVGYRPCLACRGTGWRSGVILPEIAQALPITGVVVSLGPSCQWLKIGDRVKHSKFAGHSVTTPEKETFTTMRESEVLGLLMEVKR